MKPLIRRRHTDHQDLLLYQNTITKSKKTIFRDKCKAWIMVFCICIMVPYIISVFWGDRDKEEQGSILSEEADSRIRVEIILPGGRIRLSMEEYLVGQLANVALPEYEMEMLKAQAILLRSTLIKKYRDAMLQTERSLKYYTVSSDEYLTIEQRQALWGEQFTAYDSRCKEAVNATQGIYLTYQEVPIEGIYCRVSAGMTRSATDLPGLALPYLQTADCPKDYLCEEYITEITITNSKAQALLGGRLGMCKTDKAGYCVEALIHPDEGEVIRESGEWLRIQLGLPSANFTLLHEDNTMRFVCKGQGHGFGLSQFAANELAKDGGTYEDILRYFLSEIEFDKYE
ncbi:MAG: SpoIID/LytB domain-containing protein [Lachnospiraceae bacterium]|jgi:stage II sporulation protein D|nr:SpoIID/LytB domain-containing protein [Lachnospiraceae bacterium]